MDKELISRNPKIFMGYSDCTNLHLFLWNLGIVSYYGGSIAPKEAADLWNITTRAARSRLKKMVGEGVIHRIASSEKDPKATFILSKGA